MTVASGSNHDTWFVPESAYGVTPDDGASTPTEPNWQPLPHTSNSLQLSKDAIESETLRSNRQKSDPRHGNESITGDIGVELAWSYYDDFLEAALMGTWTSDVLKVGTTRRSFSILRHFKDIDEYVVYTGCEINSVSMSVQPNQMVTMTFSIIGQGYSTGLPANSSFATYGTHTPMSSWDGTIKEGGTSVAIVTSLEPSVENNMNALFVVGQKQTLRPDVGMSTTTGSLSAYFEDQVLLDKYRNETESSLSIETKNPNGDSYTILAPRVKYMSGNVDVSGEGALTQSLDYTMMYDADTTETNIQITRAAAA